MKKPDEPELFSTPARLFVFDLLTAPAMAYVRLVAWCLGITIDFYPEDEK